MVKASTTSREVTPTDVVTGQPDVEPPVGQVEVGMVIHLLGGQRDCVDELDRGEEVAGVEAGVQPVDQHPPIGQLFADQLQLRQRALRVGRRIGLVAHSRHLPW
jgi:hypothetical protein